MAAIASVGGFKYFFDCDCSVCKKFWRETFGRDAANILSMSVAERTALSNPILRLGDKFLKIGDRVKVWGKFGGTFWILLQFKLEFWVIQFCRCLIVLFSPVSLPFLRPLWIHDHWASIMSIVYLYNKGTIKYLGPLDESVISPEVFIGVKLDEKCMMLLLFNILYLPVPSNKSLPTLF